jgi:xanthine dehydrogenase YagS FAD-binding subunit
VRPFSFERVTSPNAAVAAFSPDDARGPAVASHSQYLAGGTTLLDLMKLDVMRPDNVIDINALDRSVAGQISIDDRALRLGGLARMAEAADDPRIKQDYPVIAQSLQQAASGQLRNMASLAGNVLQRTRCQYFRDVSYAQCNKRTPGSGCAALDGFNRIHAVLGTSEQCIASYPGDFAQALIALDAAVEMQGPHGPRTIPFMQLHRQPTDRPEAETTLAPGELIVGFRVPAAPWTRRSLYLKVRDRASYEFALTSAAVALDLSDGKIRTVRIALGGVATVPWRAREAESMLSGKALDDAVLRQAADAAFANARPSEHNGFKVELGKRTLVRALKQAAAMEL